MDVLADSQRGDTSEGGEWVECQYWIVGGEGTTRRRGRKHTDCRFVPSLVASIVDNELFRTRSGLQSSCSRKEDLY